MTSNLITPAMLARGQRAPSAALAARYDHATQQGSLDHRAAGRQLMIEAAPLAKSIGFDCDGPPVPDGDIQ